MCFSVIFHWKRSLWVTENTTRIVPESGCTLGEPKGSQHGLGKGELIWIAGAIAYSVHSSVSMASLQCALRPLVNSVRKQEQKQDWNSQVGRGG